MPWECNDGVSLALGLVRAGSMEIFLKLKIKIGSACTHGFWRFIMLAFMFYHYPGFAACVTVLKGLLNTLVMVIVSAVFWIGLLYWVC
jgi:hypothetical protein